MPNVDMINPPGLGEVLFPYSQATRAGDLLFLAGQVALDERNAVIAPGDAYEQTVAIIDRIKLILADSGLGLENVASATVFVTSLDTLPDFNRAWAECFGEHRPARATVVAGLLIEGLVVEVQSIAVA